jgi:O-antigen ligase
MPDVKPSGTLLSRIVTAHFCGLVVFTSWAFGGQAPWVRDVIAGAGGAGVLLFVIICLKRPWPAGLPSYPALRYLWPLWLYDGLVIASCFNPAFKEVRIAGEASLVMADPIPWLPTAARPWLAWKELWQFNAIVLSAFNLFLVLRARREVRTVLYVLGGNAVALAVFGTFQKLAGAGGLWFGLVPSPNKYFFSSFIYHNHWGAFILLNTAVCLALLFHAFRRGGTRDLWHSPVLMGVVVTVLLAASVPLSGSRSSTGLAGLLLLGALADFLLRVIRRRRERGAPVTAPVAGIVVAAVLAAAAIVYLGRGSIIPRLQQTTTQLSSAQREVTFGSRLTLYRDTWRMAAAKPWFGWGLESYAHVFRVFNSQRSTELWIWIPFYAEAHNDWLQSLAETGFVGTGLLLLLGWLPLRGHLRRAWSSSVPRYLLTGCGLILLYAWVEFPFANPAVVMTFCGGWYLAARHLALDALHD